MSVLMSYSNSDTWFLRVLSTFTDNYLNAFIQKSPSILAASEAKSW
jgi:hypothetical protein